MAEDEVSNSSGGRLPLSGIRETGRVLSAKADSYSASNGESYPYYQDNSNDNYLDRGYSYNGYYYDHDEMRHNDSRNEDGDYCEDGDDYYEEDYGEYSDEYSVDSDYYSDYSDDYSEGYADDGYSSGGYWSE